MLWKRPRIKRRQVSPERRREPRFDDGVEVKLVPQETGGSESDKHSYYVRAKNVSPSGLKVESAVPIPVGMVASVIFRSPKTRRDIRVSAEVKWVKKLGDGEAYETGLEFVKTSIHSIIDLIAHIYKG